MKLTVGVLAGIFVLAYLILCGYARRLLLPSEAWIFAAAVMRATPAHLEGSNPLATLSLGGEAFGSPAKTTVLTTAGREYPVPLPPYTVPARQSAGAPPRFITFATPEQRQEYLRATLVHDGWRYREQFGSVHTYERDTLFLSVRSTFHVGTRVGELRMQLTELASSRPRTIPAPARPAGSAPPGE